MGGRNWICNDFFHSFRLWGGYCQLHCASFWCIYDDQGIKGSQLGNSIIGSIGVPGFVLVGRSMPWDSGMNRKCCVCAMQQGVWAARLLAKRGEGPCSAVRSQGCLCPSACTSDPFGPLCLNRVRAVEVPPSPSGHTGAAPQPETRERSAHLRKVLFPPFPFPFKALGQAVWFLSGLCRTFKWGHSGSLINPVQLSLHPWLTIVLGPSPLPQCILRQLNICLKTDCQEEVLAKPSFSSSCMYVVQHNTVYQC